MKYLKRISLMGFMGLFIAFGMVTTASATIIESGGGSTYLSGTSITDQSEGTVYFDTFIGGVKCHKSHLEGETTNDGGAGVNVNTSISFLSWSECDGTVNVLKQGTGSIAGHGNGNGTLSSTGTEVTIQYLGFHCIFKTNSTNLGLVTGSQVTGSNATVHLGATVPRTGGSSGAFCGSTSSWTGSYKINSPESLNIT